MTGAERVGDVLPLFGALKGGERRKKLRDGLGLAIDGRRSNILHTTTNRKQAAATEGTMKGTCDKQEAWGKHDTIVLGRHYS